MLNENIKVIIFDCYDTLLSIHSNQAYKIFFNSLKEIFSLSKENINDLYHLVLSEKNIDWEKVLLSLNKNLDEKSKNELTLALTKLQYNLLTDNQSISPYPDLNALSILKKEYNLILYSNLAQGYEVKINSILKPYFNKIYLSFETGLKKPDKQVFKLIKNELEQNHNFIDALQYNNMALIDDKVANINSAKELGMQAILIDRKLSHLNAINTIRQLLY